MESFEQEVKRYLNSKDLKFIDNSAAYKLLDFTIQNFISEKKGNELVHRNLYLEVKEKRQKYNLINWTEIETDSEYYTFIVDELSCRKILAYAPFSGLLVRNNLNTKYYWFSILDLFLMPKRRVNRPIKKNTETYLKGKILLDFRNANESSELETVFSYIYHSIEDRTKLYTEVNECYGCYHHENIKTQGIVRNPNHWDIDVNETR